MIANVIIGLVMVSAYNFTYFSNILEHLDVSTDISKKFSSLLGSMAKIHPNLEIYHKREPLFTFFLIDFSYDIQLRPIRTSRYHF